MMNQAEVERTAAVTPERIMQMAWGFGPPLILSSAVEARVFDALAEAPKTIEQLSELTGNSERGLRAICDALVGLALLERRAGMYALTGESRAFLVSDSPGFLGGLIQHFCRQVVPNWLHLEEAVRSGRPAVSLENAKQGPEFFAKFVEGLFPMSYRAAQGLGEHLEISKVDAPFSLLDVGAGSGVWGIAMGQMSPHVRILAVDWPEVLEVTKRVASRNGVGDRLRTSAGDLHEADFGAGHQLATVGHILHSEGAERSRRLLRKIFDALAPGGTIAIAEFLPNDERTGPPLPLMFAVNMLVHTDSGGTFTFAEVAAWLKEAGFVNPRTLDVPGPSPLILADKPR